MRTKRIMWNIGHAQCQSVGNIALLSTNRCLKRSGMYECFLRQTLLIMWFLSINRYQHTIEIQPLQGFEPRHGNHWQLRGLIVFVSSDQTCWDPSSGQALHVDNQNKIISRDSSIKKWVIVSYHTCICSCAPYVPQTMERRRRLPSLFPSRTQRNRTQIENVLMSKSSDFAFAGYTGHSKYYLLFTYETTCVGSEYAKKISYAFEKKKIVHKAVDLALSSHIAWPCEFREHRMISGFILAEISVMSPQKLIDFIM